MVNKVAVPFGVTPDGEVRTVNEVSRGLACDLATTGAGHTRTAWSRAATATSSGRSPTR